MPPKGGGGGNKFWGAIANQKQDTVRWCLNYGGISHFTRDDEGYTGLHRAAQLGKIRSLETILDHIRRQVMSRGGGDIRGTNARKRRHEELDTKDEDVGLTAFMWACKNGHLECAMLLLENSASRDLKSDEGLTAEQYAKNSKKEGVIRWFERGCVEEEEEEEEDEDYIEGETPAERRKRIKAKKAGLDRFAAMSQKKEEEKEEEEDEDLMSDVGPGPDPIWDEIKTCREGNKADLVCLRQDTKDKEVDPSLWYCRHVNNLKLRMPPGILGELPAQLELLNNLTTLIVSNNALQRLPPELQKLSGLKNLEFSDNQVDELPAEISELEHLEVLDACRNKIVDLKPLKSLNQLVTVKLDENQIKTLAPLAFKRLERLTTLSVSNNQIVEVDEKIARLGALTHLNLSNNSIKELPVEMGEMREKVLLHVGLDENPLKDSKVKKILEKGRAPVKELLDHLRKEKERNKGKKKKAKDEDEDDEEEEDKADEPEPEAEDEPEPEPEPTKPAAGGGGGGKKKKGKGGGGGGGGKGKGGGGGMSEAEREAKRLEAMRKLGMAPPEPKKSDPVPPSPNVTQPPTPARDRNADFEDDLASDMEKATIAAPDFDVGEEAGEDDFAAFITVKEEEDEEEEDDDLDDFLSDKPTESKSDRDARIKKEMEERKKGQAAIEAERAAKKKELDEWLASMTPEERERYHAEQERKQRAQEQAVREAEIEREQRRMEEMRRKAEASGVASKDDGGDKKDAKIENKWSYVGDKLVAEQVERKGPKKTVKEIQIRFPSRKVGLIIGKAGVNIKIIEGKSKCKLNIHKQQAGEEQPEDALVTIKGRPEGIDVACETINLVFAQFKAQRAAKKA